MTGIRILFVPRTALTRGFDAVTDFVLQMPFFCKRARHEHCGRMGTIWLPPILVIQLEPPDKESAMCVNNGFGPDYFSVARLLDKRNE